MDGNDTVKYEMFWLYFCKYGITNLRVKRLGEQRFIATVFQEWTHTEAFQAEGHSVAFVEHLHDFRQQDGIGKLHFIDSYIVSHLGYVCLVLGNGCMTDAGCFFVGQAVECVDAYALYDACHVVADGIEDVLVPLHG